MVNCGTRESGVVAAHAHEFVLMVHGVGWVGDDDLCAAEEEGVDFLAGWCHHCRSPVVFGDSGYGYEVVFLNVGNCFVGEIANNLIRNFSCGTKSRLVR